MSMFENAEKNVTVIGLTGGPCGGKSTVISQSKRMLEDRGINVLTLPEAATHFFSDIGIGFGEGELPPEQLQKHLIPYQKYHEDMIRSLGSRYQNKVLILLDRTIVDSLAYMNQNDFDDILESTSLSHDELLSGERYDGIIDLVTAADGAEEFYTLENNEARTETPEQARELEQKVQQAYNGAHNYQIVGNSTDFSEKVETVQKAILQILGLETIRSQKTFLVNISDMQLLIKEAKKIQIDQKYLKNSNGLEERVRARKIGDTISYSHTLKTSQQGEKREVKEALISETEYKLLSQQTLSSISKTRWTLLYENQIIEIDEFQVGGDILEEGEYLCQIKILGEDTEIKLPSFIKTQKEVSNNSKYLNFNLAENI